ncbi:MAG: molybdopterin-dependent oxidoreductase [bacterium]
MTEIIVDDSPVEVDQNNSLLFELRQAGFDVPGLCFHPRLNNAGSCRLCAVEINGELKFSCETTIEPGLEVVTKNTRIDEYRRNMLEILLANHPPDCLTCDRAGNCQLQEYEYDFGKRENSLSTVQTNFSNLNAGTLIDYKPRRCIRCHRCTEFYHKVAGGNDFNMHGKSKNMYPGRKSSQPLESELAGNMIDLCPAGTLLDSTALYQNQGGVHLQQTTSVSAFNSLQAPIKVMHRENKIVQIKNAPETNFPAPWIDDKTRFTHEYNGEKYRPELTDTTIRKNLKNINQLLHGTNAAKTGGIISQDRTLEELYLFNRLFTEKINSDFCATSPGTGNLKVNARRLENIKNSDFILVAGTNFRDEYSLLTPLLREAVEEKTTVAYLTYWGGELTFAPHIFKQDRPDELLKRFERLAGGEIDNKTDQKLKKLFEKSNSPLFISCEGRTLGPNLTNQLINWGKDQADYIRLAPGANFKAAELIFDSAPQPTEVLKKAADGELEVLFTYGFDLLRSFPDRNLVKNALKGIDKLIVADYLKSSLTDRADILLPLTTQFEEKGTLINAEGRIRFRPEVVCAPDKFLPGWKILAYLAYSASERDKIEQKNVTGECFQTTDELKNITPPKTTQKTEWINIKNNRSTPSTAKNKLSDTRGKWVIYSEPYLFSGDRRCQVCPGLQELIQHSVIECNAGDAHRLGADNSTQLTLKIGDKSFTRPVEITGSTPPGGLMIPWNLREDIPAEIFEGDRTYRRINSVGSTSSGGD